jgi:hypothetical protein
MLSLLKTPSDVGAGVKPGVSWVVIAAAAGVRTRGYLASRVDHAKLEKEPGLAETTPIVYVSFAPRSPGAPDTVVPPRKTRGHNINI